MKRVTQLAGQGQDTIKLSKSAECSLSSPQRRLHGLCNNTHAQSPSHALCGSLPRDAYSHHEGAQRHPERRRPAPLRVVAYANLSKPEFLPPEERNKSAHDVLSVVHQFLPVVTPNGAAEERGEATHLYTQRSLQKGAKSHSTADAKVIRCNLYVCVR